MAGSTNISDQKSHRRKHRHRSSEVNDVPADSEEEGRSQSVRRSHYRRSRNDSVASGSHSSKHGKESKDRARDTRDDSHSTSRIERLERHHSSRSSGTPLTLDNVGTLEERHRSSRSRDDRSGSSSESTIKPDDSASDVKSSTTSRSSAATTSSTRRKHRKSSPESITSQAGFSVKSLLFGAKVAERSAQSAADHKKRGKESSLVTESKLSRDKHSSSLQSRDKDGKKKSHIDAPTLRPAKSQKGRRAKSEASSSGSDTEREIIGTTTECSSRSKASIAITEASSQNSSFDRKGSLEDYEFRLGSQPDSIKASNPRPRSKNVHDGVGEPVVSHISERANYPAKSEATDQEVASRLFQQAQATRSTDEIPTQTSSEKLRERFRDTMTLTGDGQPIQIHQVDSEVSDCKAAIEVSFNPTEIWKGIKVRATYSNVETKRGVYKLNRGKLESVTNESIADARPPGSFPKEDVDDD